MTFRSWPGDKPTRTCRLRVGLSVLAAPLARVMHSDACAMKSATIQPRVKGVVAALPRLVAMAIPQGSLTVTSTNKRTAHEREHGVLQHAP